MVAFREEKMQHASLRLEQLKPGTWVIPANQQDERHCWIYILMQHDTSVFWLYGELVNTWQKDTLVIPIILLRIERGVVVWREASPDEWPQFLKDAPEPDAEAT